MKIIIVHCPSFHHCLTHKKFLAFISFFDIMSSTSFLFFFLLSFCSFQSNAFAINKNALSNQRTKRMTGRNVLCNLNQSKHKDEPLYHKNQSSKISKQSCDDLGAKNSVSLNDNDKIKFDTFIHRPSKTDGSTLHPINHHMQFSVFSERQIRSLLKIFQWRFFAGSLTLFTSLILLRNFVSAFKIAASDYVAEELFTNIVNKGSHVSVSTGNNPFIKAFFFRILAFCHTTKAVYIFGGKDMKVSTFVALSDTVLKILSIFLYERLWSKVEWGEDYQMNEEK